ncbi:MAG: fluoride efflux transporter CrcB [Coxiellaceae bacterium]|nr:fluoride efflux transporter CrcB [Coxiellaceae bacterium]
MLTLFEYVAVMIGGALGSCMRFALTRAVQRLPLEGGFPFGILSVNIIGSFVIGLLATLLVGKYHLGPPWRAGIFIGVLGGFTTFSSFSLDTMTLFESGNYLYGFANIVVSLLMCLAAAALGLYLGRLFMHG